MYTTIKRFLFALSLALVGWIVVMAAVMRFSDAAPAAVVFFPDDQLMAALPAATGILDMTSVSLTLANTPGLAKSLYQSGALIVLPAGLAGCLPLSDAQRRALANR